MASTLGRSAGWMTSPARQSGTHHLTHNVHRGRMKERADFYERMGGAPTLGSVLTSSIACR